MEKLKNISQKFWKSLVVVAMVLGCAFTIQPAHAAVDIGANPAPDIDIVVSMPSDYPGTFLDFKEEMTQKLIEAGVPEDKFRITDPAVKIDTTDLSGWYVYDHYYNPTTYNNLGLDPDRQPYAAADNSCTGSSAQSKTPIKITEYIAEWKKNHSGQTPQYCANLESHIESVMEDNGTASIYFMGYGTNPLTDYLFYPAAKDTRRTMSFNIEANKVDTHTLQGAGYLLNAGVDKNGNLQGYVFYYNFTSQTGGNAYIYKLKGVNASTNMRNTTLSNNCTVVAQTTFSIPNDTKKIRVTAELTKDKVTLQQQNYKADGSLDVAKDMFRDRALDVTGFNGVGPIVSYTSHGCSSLSAFTFTDVVMTYDANAFEALQNSQYYEEAKQKYFINLGNTKGEASIPANEEAYIDGIKRLNENNIFYISNVNDGQVLREPTYDDKGNIVDYGLTPENGCYATSSSYVDQMVEYIAKNYKEEVEFKKIQFDNKIPLADFYVKMDTDEGKSVQVMTIHKQHLVNAPEGTTVHLNIKDKSLPSKDGTGIKYWRYKVYDPNGDVKAGSDDWLDSLDKIPDIVFDKNTLEGKWTFELTVKDDTGAESSICQTYATVFLDNQAPKITVQNTPKKNGKLGAAKITLEDQGAGIADDGITIIENEGSGVKYYCVNSDATQTPSDSDWVKVPNGPVHEYTFIEDMDDWAQTGLAVWTKDECGNVASTQLFKPCHITVLNNDLDEVDDYWVMQGTTLNNLPEAEPTITIDDVIYWFGGWVILDESGTPITEGSELNTSSVTIRPVYSHDTGTLVFDANGGTIDGTKEYSVPAGVSLQSAVNNYGKNVTPVKEGYDFIGWTTDKAGKNEISTERITKDTTTTVYAQWKIKEYNLIFNPNGGRVGATRSKSVQYNTPIAKTIADTTGRFAPTKDGYIFMGWSENQSNNENEKLIQASDTLNMPAKDKTVYAVWKKDTTKFIVTYDSGTEDPNASPNSTQEYLKNDTKVTSYANMPTPTRSGYEFTGWYYNDTKVENGTTFASTAGKEDHTLVAKWAPVATNYTIQYYVNSGKVLTDKNGEAIKDENGNVQYEYTLVNAATKTKKEVTGTNVSVSEADKIAELSKGNYGLTQDYWYNADNKNNVFDGTVIGNPYLSLKLYYERFFKVNVTTSGQGTTNASQLTKVKEGDTPTVTWKPAEGWYVSKVMVDGKIRDDLCELGQYTYPEGFHEDHNILVTFSKKGSTSTVKPGEEKTDPNFYEVSTGLMGCNDGSCAITNSQRFEEGKDANVQLTLGEGYRISSVTVDGIEYKNYDELTGEGIEFKGLKSNHSVLVIVEKLPTIGGGSTVGQYTITVNRYGGGVDDEGTDVSVSPNGIVNKGDSYRVDWNGNKKYEVYKVVVDGEEFTGNFSRFNNIRANHIVDVYFREISKGGTTPEVPSFDKNEYVSVTTQINGGPGTITGNAIIEKGNDYNVNWTITNNSSDPDSDDYTCFEVDSVVVNGEVVKPQEDGKYDLTNVDKDTKVVVNVKAEMYNVDTYKYGAGTISISRVLYKGQNYNNITAVPDAGYAIAKIIVDGETKFDATETASAQAATFSARDSEVTVTQSDADNLAMYIRAISEDHEVRVFFTRKTTDPDTGEVTIDPVPDTTYKVSGQFIDVSTGKEPVGKNGKIEGQCIVDENGNATLSWTLPDGYKLVKVAENGEEVEVTGNELTINDIASDKDVKIYVQKDTPDDTIIIPGDFHTNEYSIETNLQGSAGIITNSSVIAEGLSKTVEWSVTKVEGHDYKVKYVIVDGVFRNDLVEDYSGSITFDDIHENHKVIVVLYDKIPSNVDTDGDGKPDLNVDKDEDGDPDLNVDTDGDGIPDINIVDKDGDGEPDDLDDLTPDEIKDLEPDVNIDKDKDGKPDVNVDTDDDGKPDVNIDTDGDGDPDINIVDKDHDGKPDNIDPKDPEQDKTPNINIVDKDGDGKPDDLDDLTPEEIKNLKPDVNIDTDKDGKPDLNVDVTGDGIPNINIVDKDHDGKPDKGIDPNAGITPDVNIDIDGDGKPDINIDTDGDGLPDINIDADGDGIIDVIPTDSIINVQTGNSSIQTGDSTSVGGFMFALATSFIAIIGLLYMRKKEDYID